MTDESPLLVTSAQLRGGDPSTGKYTDIPSSYTLFVFPFAYHQEIQYGLGKSDRFYTPVDMSKPEWVHRHRYLTAETSKVLFENGAWFDLSGSPETFECRLVSGNFQIRVQACTLVMFEWDAPKEKERRFFSSTDQTKQHDFMKLGFLILHTRVLPSMENGKQKCPNLDDLLKFNELFRYYRQPFDDHHQRMSDLFADKRAGKKALYLDRWLKYLDYPVQDSKGLRWRIIPNDMCKASVEWWEREHRENDETGQHVSAVSNGQPDIFVYNDNRAFVWSCALLDKGEASLGAGEGGMLGDEFSHNWVRLLNVDRPYEGTDAKYQRATAFEQQWAAGRTYTRWRHYGCLYGFNYHSGAMLASPLKDPPTWKHFYEQYFDMLLLLLYLRITIFRFSRELVKISELARFEADMDNDVVDQFRRLRKKFAVFTNLYQYPLISNQQQAIEMYAMLRKQLDVDEMFREVESEVKNTHELMELRNSANLGKRANSIAYWGIPFTIAAFFVALFGVSDIKEIDSKRLFEVGFSPESWSDVTFSLSAEAVGLVCLLLLLPLLVVFRRR